MKISRLAVLAIVVCGTCIATADSISTINITQAAIGILPNNSAGDNLGITLTGPGGFVLEGVGGTSAFGFVGDTFAAGDFIGGVDLIGWSFLTLKIGNITYDPDVVDLSALNINLFGGLTVPGGSVPATLSNSFGGPIQVRAGGDQFIQLNLNISPGTFSASFQPSEGNPSLYEFSSAGFESVRTVPEPETMMGVVTGLVAMMGDVLRRRRRPT